MRLLDKQTAENSDHFYHIHYIQHKNNLIICTFLSRNEKSNIYETCITFIVFIERLFGLEDTCRMMQGRVALQALNLYSFACVSDSKAKTTTCGKIKQ